MSKKSRDKSWLLATTVANRLISNTSLYEHVYGYRYRCALGLRKANTVTGYNWTKSSYTLRDYIEFCKKNPLSL